MKSGQDIINAMKDHMDEKKALHFATDSFEFKVVTPFFQRPAAPGGSPDKKTPPRVAIIVVGRSIFPRMMPPASFNMK